MNHTDQTSLLRFMERGVISENNITKTRQMELRSWFFGTANNCEKIIQPFCQGSLYCNCRIHF